MKILKIMLLSALLPLSANAAAELTLSNNTDTDATGMVNGGFCSSAFGDQGIIRAHSSIFVSTSQLALACGTNPHACTTDVYMTNDCSGPKAGTVTIDIDTGITNIEVDGNYKVVSTDPQHVEINPA